MAHRNTDRTPSSGNEPMPQTGPNAPVDHSHKQFDTYTNLKSFKEKNQTVIELSRNIKQRCEEVLSDRVLETDIDDALLEAINNEWPKELQQPVEPRVTYQFYRILRNRPTTSAGMIRRRYEQAARELGSNPHFDVLKITDLILQEARLQKEGLLPQIDKNTDKAEKRIIEGAYDWCVNAESHLGSLEYVLDNHDKNSQGLKEDEISALTPQEARQAQSVFNAQYNASNIDIRKGIDFIESQFTDQAGNFYNQILIPALIFRLQVGRNIIVGNNGISQAMHKAANALDNNFEGVLGDQVRRNLLFNNQIDTVMNRLFSRERYRLYIKQLSSKGGKIRSSGLAQQQLSEEETEFWENHDPLDPDEILYTPNLRRPVDAVNADHGSLAGVDQDDAHSQYLLADGDMLTGNLDVEDGVLVDGVDVSQHSHTGEDGTQQISGDDILQGTIDDGHVNTKPPSIPENLAVSNFNQRVKPPGVTVVDTTLQWNGPEELTYEIQIFDRTGQVEQ